MIRNKVVTLTLIFSVQFAAWVYSQKKDAPAGFEQIIPRGAIAAITQPTFVSADEADIDKNSWVLGVVVDGQVRAYSLNLLNAYEVVNDQIGSTSFAAVW